jgi:hypothetical protein
MFTLLIVTLPPGICPIAVGSKYIIIYNIIKELILNLNRPKKIAVVK